LPGYYCRIHRNWQGGLGAARLFRFGGSSALRNQYQP